MCLTASHKNASFDLLERLHTELGKTDAPIVVFTGKDLSPEEDAAIRTFARSIVVKGVESPERLLDETALFLHRVIADLPAGSVFPSSGSAWITMS